MLFCITLGDWLGKGHDIKEDFLYDCNRPAAEIAAAYGMSREKYGARPDRFAPVSLDLLAGWDACLVSV